MDTTGSKAGSRAADPLEAPERLACWAIEESAKGHLKYLLRADIALIRVHLRFLFQPFDQRHLTQD